MHSRTYPIRIELSKLSVELVKMLKHSSKAVMRAKVIYDCNDHRININAIIDTDSHSYRYSSTCNKQDIVALLDGHYHDPDADISLQLAPKVRLIVAPTKRRNFVTEIMATNLLPVMSEYTYANGMRDKTLENVFGTVQDVQITVYRINRITTDAIPVINPERPSGIPSAQEHNTVNNNVDLVVGETVTGPVEYVPDTIELNDPDESGQMVRSSVSEAKLSDAQHLIDLVDYVPTFSDEQRDIINQDMERIKQREALRAEINDRIMNDAWEKLTGEKTTGIKLTDEELKVVNESDPGGFITTVTNDKELADINVEPRAKSGINDAIRIIPGVLIEKNR